MENNVCKCSNCQGLIHYGDPIVSDPRNDKVYCSVECYLDNNGCYMLYPDDEDAEDGYDTWFANT